MEIRCKAKGWTYKTEKFDSVWEILYYAFEQSINLKTPLSIPAGA